MKLKHVLAAGIPLLGIVIAGCGGGGGGGSTSAATTTTISSNAQGTTASASGTQGASLSANSATSLSNLAGTVGSAGAPKYRSPLAGKDLRFKKLHGAEAKAMNVPKKKFAAAIAKAKAAAKSGAMKATVPIASTTTSCTDGGTVTFSGSYDDQTFAYDINITYLNCKEEMAVMNGTMSASGAFATTTGAADSFTMKLGDGDSTIESTDFKVELYDDATYATKYAAYIADMTVTGTVGVDTAGTAFTFTFGANGKEAYNEYTSANDYVVSYTNFSLSSTLNVNSTTSALSGTDTTSGTVSESWKENGVSQGLSLSFSSFATTWSATYAGLASDYYEFAVSGTLTMAFTPAKDCNGLGADGTYSFETPTAFHAIIATGALTAGHMIINGNTHIQVDSTGQVVVTVDGVSGSTSYAKLDDLEQTCPIQDFEDDSAGTTTTAVTSGGSATASGKSLVANLTWTPSTTSSVMDLHVNFYAASSYTGTTPTSATAGTWYIDWHNRDQVNVLPDDDANSDGSEDTTVSFPNGTVDGNLEYYSASNTWGTEMYDFDRLVIDQLPAGYYVVSVNSWSLGSATSVTAKVTITIGDTEYDFGTHAFSVADSEGSPTVNASAWWTVGHLRVAADGTVEILPASTVSLQPWHNGAFGMTAPAVNKALGARGVK